MKEKIEVVYPLGEAPVEVQLLAPRLDTLEGKTICELVNQDWKGDIIFNEKLNGLEKLLPDKYPGIKLISATEFGYTDGAYAKETIKALPGNLLKHGCDAVISVLGT